MIGNRSTTSTMQPIESTRVTKIIIDSTTTHFALHSEFSSSTINVEQSQTSTNPPDQSTIGPGSVQPQSDPLLGIILGVVGGLIALLLFAIVLLLVIIAVRKKHTPQSSREDRYINIYVIN